MLKISLEVAFYTIVI